MRLKTCQFDGCTHEFSYLSPSPVCCSPHVFLGGVCGKNAWRDGFIERLVSRGMPRQYLFNPVVESWTPECQVREDFAKQHATVCLYYLADPKSGDGHLPVYSLVEATMALYDKRHDQDLFVVLDSSGISGHAAEVMKKIAHDLQSRFGPESVLPTLELAEEKLVLNTKKYW